MDNKLSNSDVKILKEFEKMVMDINNLLRGKTNDEMNSFFDEQIKIYESIDNLGYRLKIMESLEELRLEAIKVKNKFSPSISKITDSLEILEGKSLEEITGFFDEIDRQLSEIPNMKQRQLIKRESEYFRKRNEDEALERCIEERLNQVEADRKKAGSTEDKVKVYFKSINDDISKINDRQRAFYLEQLSEILEIASLGAVSNVSYEEIKKDSDWDSFVAEWEKKDMQ